MRQNIAIVACELLITFATHFWQCRDPGIVGQSDCHLSRVTVWPRYLEKDRYRLPTADSFRSCQRYDIPAELCNKIEWYTYIFDLLPRIENTLCDIMKKYFYLPFVRIT